MEQVDELLWVLLLEWLEELDVTTPNVPVKQATVAKQRVVFMVPPEVQCTLTSGRA